MTAYTLEQAREWFLSNSYGSLPCVNNGRTQECHSFLEAEEFYGTTYGEETHDDSDDSPSIIGMGLGLAASSLFSGDDSSPSIDTTPDTTPDTPSSFDSGGGDFGGGGGGSDF